MRESETIEMQKTEELLSYLQSTQHVNLKHAISQVEADLQFAEKPGDAANDSISKLKKNLHEIKEEVLETIKMEERMIFPHIRSLLLYYDAATAERDFHNLSSPVRTLIIKHHNLLDKIRDLLQVVSSLGYEGYSDSDYRKTFTDLFEFYSFYEKLVYMEENILFPSLVSIFEFKTPVK
jgi:iron-sulfur cluster repair protein YtfE (RIC family)